MRLDQQLPPLTASREFIGHGAGRRDSSESFQVPCVEEMEVRVQEE